ncbi:MAG: hypothetical protein PHO90_02780 [Candidatus Pacebacteria bacterium]|nr:hypothetical protein [Candidatus Paceibacterota bacterium]
MDLKFLLTGRIDTIDQARKIYNKSYWNKEERSLSLARWNELCLPQLEAIVAAKDVKAFIQSVSSCEFPPKGEAHEKATAWLQTVLSDLTSSVQMADFYNKFACYLPKGHYFSEMINKKWNALSQAEIERASDFEALRAIGQHVNPQSNTALISKWAEYCQSFEQIQEVTIFLDKKEYYCRPHLDSDARKKVQQKRESILFAAIPKVENIETIKLYHSTSLVGSQDSAVTVLALEKWLSLCTTSEQADEAFKAAKKQNNDLYIRDAYKTVKALLPTA